MMWGMGGQTQQQASPQPASTGRQNIVSALMDGFNNTPLGGLSRMFSSNNQYYGPPIDWQALPNSSGGGHNGGGGGPWQYLSPAQQQGLSQEQYRAYGVPNSYDSQTGYGTIKNPFLFGTEYPMYLGKNYTPPSQDGSPGNAGGY